MMLSPESASFKTFLREAEERGEPRAEFVDASGRRCVYEHNPQLGVLRRVTMLDAAGEIITLTTAYRAADERWDSYPAGSPFVAGHDVTVVEHRGAGDPMLAWEQVEDADALTRQIEAALMTDGWVVDAPPDTVAQRAIAAAKQATGIGMAFTRFARGDGKRMLMSVVTAGARGNISLTSLPNEEAA